MIEQIISLVSLSYGSYEDIRTREIPDTLSFGLIYVGFALALLASIFFWSYKPLLASIIGFGVCALVGFLFYYTGQWGGGDAKIIMGLGSIIGLNIFVLNEGVPDLLILIINLFLIGAIYGLFWFFFLAVKNWKVFREEFREARRTRRMVRIRIIILSIVLLFTVIVFLLKLNLVLFVGIYLLLLITVLSVYVYLVVKTVEKTCLVKKINVSKLTEGDWIVEKIKLKSADKEIYTKTGISEKGIAMLKKAGKKKVMVKEGIPFVPSFLFAYIALLVLGNWLPI